MSEPEFVRWCSSDTWAEWVDGEVVLMSPVSYDHETISTFLLRILAGFVEANDLGVVLKEPFQVRFAQQRRRRSPDMFFVSASRQRLIKKHEVDGPPDLIVEVVSPESQARDWREKYLEYEGAGVREYWIVDPLSQRVEIYALTRRGYARLEEKDGRIYSKILKGVFVSPAWPWGRKLPKVSTVLREFGIQT